MGIIRKTLLTATAGTAAAVGYLHASTELVTPLPKNDPLWTSRAYKKHNIYDNPSTQDVVVKRIPLDKIKPELLQKDGALVTEFCRGVWGGLAYDIQRRYLARKYRNPATSSQLWSRPELATSTYSPGTQITDHFEVVDKTATAITVRCGDSPLQRSGPRDSDGLFVMTADVTEGEAVLGLKSCFFGSAKRVEGTAGPMPLWMDILHRWYARAWMVSASWRLLR